MKNDSTSEPRFLALLLAAVFPGLGHMVSGEVYRGGMVAVGVLGLFFGGMLIGGIDVIDSRENRIWFIGQALVGPVALGVDWAHQNQFKAYDPSVMGVVSKQELDRIHKRSAYPNEVKEMRTVSTNSGTFTVPVFLPAPAGAAGSPPNRSSVGKVNELGTLFATIAGMLNLIAILDAGFPGRPRKQERSPKPAELGAP